MVRWKTTENHWSKIGYPHPMLGKHHSDESKRKISASKTGVPVHSEEEKIRRRFLAKTNLNIIKTQFKTGFPNPNPIKISETMRAKKINTGAENPMWRGGITPETLRLRKSFEYKQWRKSVFERDNYTCQWCDGRGGILHADHIKLWSKFPKLRYVLSNGRTLCKKCHHKRHRRAPREERGR